MRNNPLAAMRYIQATLFGKINSPQLPPSRGHTVIRTFDGVARLAVQPG
jgi:hypothetical protein